MAFTPTRAHVKWDISDNDELVWLSVRKAIVVIKFSDERKFLLKISCRSCMDILFADIGIQNGIPLEPTATFTGCLPVKKSKI